MRKGFAVGLGLRFTPRLMQTPPVPPVTPPVPPVTPPVPPVTPPVPPVTPPVPPATIDLKGLKGGPFLCLTSGEGAQGGALYKEVAP